MAGILQGSRGKPTYKLKCVVVGDLGVGKTTLVKSYADSGENDDPKSAWQKEISMDSCVVCLTIWDTAGTMSVYIRIAKSVNITVVSLLHMYNQSFYFYAYEGGGGCDFHIHYN